MKEFQDWLTTITMSAFFGTGTTFFVVATVWIGRKMKIQRLRLDAEKKKRDMLHQAFAAGKRMADVLMGAADRVEAKNKEAGYNG